MLKVARLTRARSLDPDAVAAHLRMCNALAQAVTAPGAASVSPSELVRQILSTEPANLS